MHWPLSIVNIVGSFSVVLSVLAKDLARSSSKILRGIPLRMTAAPTD
jgi:hypothetical protein